MAKAIKIPKVKSAKVARGKHNYIAEAVNTNVKGIGSYSKGKMTKGGLFRSNEPSQGMTRRQIYNLEKEAQRTQRMMINTKPEMIKAIGQAVAYNTTGAQAGIATGVATGIQDKVANSKTVNNLITAGTGQTTKDNQEEEENKISDLSEYVVR